MKVGQASMLLEGLDIMLIEDSDNPAKMLVDFLEFSGAKVRWLNDSLDALYLLENKNTFDLVMCDLKDQNLVFIKKALKIADKKLPCIAILENDCQHQIGLAMSAGYSSYMIKPVDLKKLLECLAKFI